AARRALSEHGGRAHQDLSYGRSAGRAAGPSCARMRHGRKMHRMSSVPQKLISPEEYLRLERAAETKSEYVDGVIYAMAGARDEHNLIVTGLLSFLRYNLPSRCRAYPSDLK